MDKDYLKITIYEDGTHDVQELSEKAYDKLLNQYNNVETWNGITSGAVWFQLAHCKVILCKKEHLGIIKNKFNRSL